MAVPYTFGTATASIPLSNLDSNFATTITLGNTAIQLGNTVTTLNNMTLANVTVSSGSVTLTNITATTANVTTANISGTTTLTNLTASTALALDASKNIASVTNTGTGNNVLATSPTITTPTISSLTSAAATALTLQSAGTTAVTVDTSQNVGIGTTTPTSGYKLNVGSTSAVTTLNGAAITLFTSGSLTSNVGGVLNFRPQLGTTISDIFNLSICAYDHSGDGNADGLSINGSDGVSFSTGGNSRSERMRIDSGGRWMLNTTNGLNGGSAKGSIVFNGSSEQGLFIASSAGATPQCMGFNYNTTTNVGSINITSSATSYSTSSDYRLKENIVAMSNALAIVAQLKPVKFKWKTDGSDGQGFIAHELQQVVPDCVVGTKDAVDTDGNPKHQSVDTSFLVATLTAALQEAHGLIKDLQARVDALEAK